MLKHEQRVHASFLTKCSPEAAYEWLQDNWRRPDKGLYSDTYRVGEEQEGRLVLEWLLLRRRNPLIDLGLGREATRMHRGASRAEGNVTEVLR